MLKNIYLIFNNIYLKFIPDPALSLFLSEKTSKLCYIPVFKYLKPISSPSCQSLSLPVLQRTILMGFMDMEIF